MDNGARTVKTDFRPTFHPPEGYSPGGSGVTVRDFVLNRNSAFRGVIHEFAHYLLGGNNVHSGFGFWGMLSAWGVKSIAANSFERYKLGWINITTVEPTDNPISNATLPDFVTSGVAYRLEIDAIWGQYFYIENHQPSSYWETTFAFGNIEPGLYLLRKDRFWPASNDGAPKYFKMIPADGRHDWTVNQLTPNPWGQGDLPVFKNLGPDRQNGYHDLNFIPWTWNNVDQTPAAIHFTEDQSGNPVEDVRNRGDGKDAFREDYNEVFSPWSNPNNQRADRSTTGFGFTINSLANGVYSIDIQTGLDEYVISQNTVLSQGVWNVTSNITVNSGVTLTIQPNTTLKFASGKSLIVNGVLNAQGTSSNKVTFDFATGINSKGIIINPDGHFDISYAIIDGSETGMYVNEGWGTIDNTEFSSMFTSLHLYRTNYSTNNVYLTDNTFVSAEEGLILEYSSPKLVGNKFSGNQIGIQASNYSSAQLGYVNQQGRNVFDYVQWNSITGYNNCNLFLGKADCITNGGYNSFKFNSMVFLFPHIDVRDHCQVTAEENWWGRSSPSMGMEFYADWSSSIDYTPYLTSDPNPFAKIIAGKSPEEAEFDNAFVSASTTSGSTGNGVTSQAVQLALGTDSLFSYFDQSWTLKRKLTFARRLLGISSSRDYTQEVKTICKDIIRDNKDSSLSFWAMDILWKAYKKSEQQIEFKQYLDILTSNQESYTSIAVELVASAELITYGFDYENEMVNLNNFIEKHKGETSIEYALYQKFMHQKNERKLEEARITAEQLGKLFPESRGYQFAIGFFEHGKKLIKKEIKVTSTLPKEYQLLGNYPNPFNPSTTISYNLPFTSEVEVTIYDMLGNEVKIFFISSQNAGNQKVIWNGTNNIGEQVASGIYLYIFKAASLEKNNEVFQKSAKLILMK